MVGRNPHEKISEALAGSRGSEIHQFLDAAFSLEKLKSIVGSETVEAIYRSARSSNSQYKKGHRQVLHTLEECILTGYALDGYRGARVGATHWIADEPMSKQDKQLLNLILKKR